MHMKKSIWQPVVRSPRAEMLAIMNSSGTPTGTTVLHVHSAGCEHPASAPCRLVKTNKTKLQQCKKNTK